MTAPMTSASAPIAKPPGFTLESFRSTKSSGLANVETLQAGLPHHKISDAKDWVRLHPDEATGLVGGVLLPQRADRGGSKKDTLHLINEELALRYLPPALIQRFRLALASKPYDHFFLCHVPSQRLDNSWNKSNLASCLQAKGLVVLGHKPRSPGDHYHCEFSKDADAFPDPTWPRAKSRPS